MMSLYRKSIQVNRNKLSLRFAIILIYIISVLFYTNNSKLGYFVIIEIMSLVFIGSIVLMVNNKFSPKNNLSMYLGTELILILVLYIFKFVLYEFGFNIINSKSTLIMTEICNIVVDFLEVFLIINSVKRIGNKESHKSLMKNTMIKAIVIICGIVVLVSTKIINENLIKFYYEYALNYIVSIIIYFYCYILIIYNIKIIDLEQQRTLFVFLNMIFMGNFISGFSAKTILSEHNIKYLLISYAMDYFAYYFVYEGFIINSLEIYYKNIYKYTVMREKSMAQRNTILRKHSVVLQELNILLEKSKRHHIEFINTINDFVCIFKDEKVEYINRGALKLIKGNFDGTYLGEKLIDFYKENLKNVPIDRITPEKKFTLSLVDKFDEVIDLELIFLDLTEGYKFLLIKNITEEKRINEKREYLKKYYEEEYLKSEFFSNISHELRTPINVISSAIQLNEISLLEGNLDRVKENNNRIRKNSLRLIRTINNFIDVNRISENYLSGEYKFCNIVNLVETVLHCSKKYFDKKNMDFVFDTEEEEIFINIDRSFTERVILNILSNYVKYGNYGGNMSIFIEIKEKQVKINIENDGKTIGEKEKTYIFDKFTKNNKSLNRENEGSGLGLYISKSLMELQGGSLSIEINENHKNMFILSFSRKIELEMGIKYDENEYNEIYLRDLTERVDIEFSDIYYSI